MLILKYLAGHIFHHVIPQAEPHRGGRERPQAAVAGGRQRGGIRGAGAGHSARARKWQAGDHTHQMPATYLVRWAVLAVTKC